ncbi:oxidoreductase [Sodiomyces alkalinus F11]|uniref:Oxidoreductase n=1 Tax=Sodiomyces alkalinus (strain CBS 110278 / VKM F-3762 / F11) TaxID=1314773 RepID=A0A3N2PWA7_SODAK|nr:oxidoreductase [Sodiomyces alkalinus F11]ROT38666.1 oxidoreductase [Sodiomyces alkalinus F11]
MPYSLTVKKTEGKPGSVYYPLQLKQVPRPTPGPNDVLVKIAAAALNHRDLFIRRHLYPGISFEHPLLSDAYGVVVEAGPGASPTLLHKPVILNPTRGWDSDPMGPEDPASFTAVGGSKLTPAGAAQEFIVVPASEVELAPDHLTPSEGAALPLVGLTAWRALVTKSNAAFPGANLLITGIGGGVALQALQFAVALGCRVFVTSGDPAKIDRARALGAVGGASYRSPTWDKDLRALLPADRPFLDAVIDGAGGDVVARSVRLLRPGGVISQYGMTVSPKMDWPMQAVLNNIELRGSTMGSRAEFKAMVDFVREKKIRPVVSRAVRGLENLEAIDGLFKDMREGKQFGKLVIEIDSIDSPDSASKL